MADRVLEDVELAFIAKRRKIGIRFRYAPDALSTRMYRTTSAMIEGWTKNLALLFDNALATSLWKILDMALLVGLPLLAAHLWNATLHPPFPRHGSVPGGHYFSSGSGLSFAFTHEWQNRTFPSSIAPSPPWDCPFSPHFSTAAGSNTAF